MSHVETLTRHMGSFRNDTSSSWNDVSRRISKISDQFRLWLAENEQRNVSECPETHAQWYCLNGASCFAINVHDTILYNCWCLAGFYGPRCDYKSKTSIGGQQKHKKATHKPTKTTNESIPNDIGEYREKRANKSIYDYRANSCSNPFVSSNNTSND